MRSKLGWAAGALVVVLAGSAAAPVGAAEFGFRYAFGTSC